MQYLDSCGHATRWWMACVDIYSYVIIVLALTRQSLN